MPQKEMDCPKAKPTFLGPLLPPALSLLASGEVGGEKLELVLLAAPLFPACVYGGMPADGSVLACGTLTLTSEPPGPSPSQVWGP